MSALQWEGVKYHQLGTNIFKNQPNYFHRGLPYHHDPKEDLRIRGEVLEVGSIINHESKVRQTHRHG